LNKKKKGEMEKEDAVSISAIKKKGGTGMGSS
jgi:hypothetical protein